MKNGILNFWRGQISNLYSFLYLFYPRSPDTGFLSAIMPRANLKNGILNFWRGQISDSIYHFLLVGIKRGGGFHIGFQKMDYVYFYGSSVRMGHKVYIIPILLVLVLSRIGRYPQLVCFDIHFSFSGHTASFPMFLRGGLGGACFLVMAGSGA